MKKIIFSLILLVYSAFSFGTTTLSTLPFPLSTGGSLTVYASGPTQLYLANGVDTLETDLSIIFSGTPLVGSQFTLWFNNTNINPNGNSIFILSNDYTSLLTGTVNLFITCTYNGSAWTVSSVDQTILNKLSDYVTSDQLSSTLQGYPTNGVLTETLSHYGLLTNSTFTQIRVPTQSTSDSSTYAASTAYVKKQTQSSTSGLASVTYVNSAISSSISTATGSITSAYTSAIASALAPFQNYQTLDTLAAGTINLTTSITGVSNNVVPTAITGNIVLTASPFPGNVSEVTIMLPFRSGNYTVTAGANMSFPVITGANTHTSVLTLQWNPVQQLYIQKSFSQN